jgi:hypothetical protein
LSVSLFLAYTPFPSFFLFFCPKVPFLFIFYICVKRLWCHCCVSVS